MTCVGAFSAQTRSPACTRGATARGAYPLFQSTSCAQEAPPSSFPRHSLNRSASVRLQYHPTSRIQQALARNASALLLRMPSLICRTAAAPAAARAAPSSRPRPVCRPTVAARFKTRDGREIVPPNDVAFDNESGMFCMQCEETVNGVGCEKSGVCGKTPDVAALQDALIYLVKGIGANATALHDQAGYFDDDVARFTKDAIFATLTNTNFDGMNLADKILTADRYLEALRAKAANLSVNLGLPRAIAVDAPALPWFDTAPHPAHVSVRAIAGDHPTIDDLTAFGFRTSLSHRRHEMRSRGLDTLLGLHEMIAYGIKGICAYAHHADNLGYRSQTVDLFIWKAMGFLASSASQDVDKVLAMAMELGAVNLETMALLDRASTETYGTPVPTAVRITPRKGKCIVVSGHDLRDLEQLLQQTEGMGIIVYTHGEMIPAHGYPKLKKYPHLAGNYGGAWYKQKKEFSDLPGAILMTTNCVLIPTDYADNLFTTGNMMAVPGVRHVVASNGKKDFSAVIKRAMELPGFDEDAEDRTVLVGFGHATVLSVADKVLEAVSQGNLRHIFLVGGCDGRQPERKYYAELVDALPQDTLVLTLGCAKYRFFDHDLGTLPNTPIPRLLDMGQCNDAYSAIAVASALADALGTDINSLPLSLDISWFEQKAVSILLTLLHLGVRNIRLGPKLPAFLTPDAVQLIVDNWGLKTPNLKDPEADIRDMMGAAA